MESLWGVRHLSQLWITKQNFKKLNYKKSSFPQFAPTVRSSNSGRTESSTEQSGILPRSPNLDFDLFGARHKANVLLANISEKIFLIEKFKNWTLKYQPSQTRFFMTSSLLNLKRKIKLLRAINIFHPYVMFLNKCLFCIEVDNGWQHSRALLSTQLSKPPFASLKFQFTDDWVLMPICMCTPLLPQFFSSSLH